MAIYTHEFIPGGLDSQLLSGFISAMTSFIGTLVGGEETQWKTEYGTDTVLLVEGGDWSYGVLAISRETTEIRSKLRRIVREFEKSYRYLRDADKLSKETFWEFDEFVMRVMVFDRLSESSVVHKLPKWAGVMRPIEDHEVDMRVMKMLMKAKSGQTVGKIAKSMRLSLNETIDNVARAFWHNAISIVYVPLVDDILALSEGSMSMLLKRDNPLAISPSTMRVIGALDGRSSLSKHLAGTHDKHVSATLLELGDLINKGYIQRISTERALVLAYECILNEILRLGRSALGMARVQEFLYSALDSGIKLHPWIARISVSDELRIHTDLHDSMSTLDLDDMYLALDYLTTEVPRLMTKKTNVGHIGSASTLAKKKCRQLWSRYIIDSTA
ncbi:MAG: hypothetical protein ACFE7R_09425, partial [Candidatus Hodarchaeota archaeon]